MGLPGAQRGRRGAPPAAAAAPPASAPLTDAAAVAQVGLQALVAVARLDDIQVELRGGGAAAGAISRGSGPLRAARRAAGLGFGGFGGPRAQQGCRGGRRKGRRLVVYGRGQVLCGW